MASASRFSRRCAPAARPLRGARRRGCAVESIRSFLTEECLDGVCRFFEARSHNDLAQALRRATREGAGRSCRLVHLAAPADFPAATSWQAYAL